MKTSLIINAYEILRDWECLIPRWNDIKNDGELRKKFCVRNRNPLFDISKNSHFITGLGSNSGLKDNDGVDDHFIQRTKAVALIFDELSKKPQMGVEHFISILRKYCSTVKLSKGEHSSVTYYCKKNEGVYNYEAYMACGIRVEGLSDFILKN